MGGAVKRATARSAVALQRGPLCVPCATRLSRVQKWVSEKLSYIFYRAGAAGGLSCGGVGRAACRCGGRRDDKKDQHTEVRTMFPPEYSAAAVHGLHRYTTYSRRIGTTGFFANVHNGVVTSFGVEPTFDPVIVGTAAGRQRFERVGLGTDEHGAVAWGRVSALAGSGVALLAGLSVLGLLHNSSRSGARRFSGGNAHVAVAS
jgi:hypothetical protein